MPITGGLFYHEYEGAPLGKTPPIVLIHGAGGNHLYWPAQLRRLPGYRVYAIDLPGHGQSGGTGQQTIASYTSTIQEWMTSIDLHSAVFFGHSMGSAIALSLALEYPEHVLGLGLLGGGVRMKVNPTLLEQTSSPTTFHNAVEALIAWSFAPQTPPELIQMASQRLAETRHSVLHADLIACEAFDLEERISEINQPTIIIVGEQDKMMPVRYSHILSNSIPHAQLEIIPGAGHMVMLEQPQVVSRILLQFLTQILH